MLKSVPALVYYLSMETMIYAGRRNLGYGLIVTVSREPVVKPIPHHGIYKEFEPGPTSICFHLPDTPKARRQMSTILMDKNANLSWRATVKQKRKEELRFAGLLTKFVTKENERGLAVLECDVELEGDVNIVSLR